MRIKEAGFADDGPGTGAIILRENFTIDSKQDADQNAGIFFGLRRFSPQVGLGAF